jgi:2-methylisocitrate lyase-like PEP mutase family enzyme
MSQTTQEKRARFRELHKDGCFVLPNPWDVGSARMLEHLGFEAVASTSTGFAWTTGRPDYAVARDDVLGHLAALSAAVDVPVNADFESGFATEPEALAANVRLAVGTGIAGLSIEDRLPGGGRLFDRQHAVERIRAARHAIDQSREDVILVARTEILLSDPAALGTAIGKLVAFADAGADCLFAPGVAGKEAIGVMVRAVAPKPVNVLVMGSDMPLAAFAELGVRRVSVGGGLAQVAWGATTAAAESFMRSTFDALATGIPGAELNEIFAKSA